MGATRGNPGYTGITKGSWGSLLQPISSSSDLGDLSTLRILTSTPTLRHIARRKLWQYENVPGSVFLPWALLIRGLWQPKTPSKDSIAIVGL